MQSLQTVILSDVEWTPQNGFLTAAQKLQRKTILNHFKAEIDVRNRCAGLRSYAHLRAANDRLRDVLTTPGNLRTEDLSVTLLQPSSFRSSQQYRSFPVHSFFLRGFTFLVSRNMPPPLSFLAPLSLFFSLGSKTMQHGVCRSSQKFIAPQWALFFPIMNRHGMTEEGWTPTVVARRLSRGWQRRRRRVFSSSAARARSLSAAPAVRRPPRASESYLAPPPYCRRRSRSRW